jgi:hypothetical protein
VTVTVAEFEHPDCVPVTVYVVVTVGDAVTELLVVEERDAPGAHE